MLLGMSRVPTLVLLLSMALVAGSSVSSPLGYITAGFRSLAQYKLAATARLASYLTGNRAVKASVALKVADAPPPEVVEPVALDVAEGPVEEVIVEPPHAFPQGAAAPLNPPEVSLSSGVVPDEDVHDFKKHFAAGYAALDFANQRERERYAAAGQQQHLQAPVIALPLEQYKDFVSAGTTGGELMRVAVVAQEVPQAYYSSHPDSLPEQAQPQLHQLQTEEPTSKTGPAPPLAQGGQSHIFPYGEWQPSTEVQEAQGPAFGLPADSPDLPSDSGAADTYADGASSSPVPQAAHQEDIVIPGSQLPLAMSQADAQAHSDAVEEAAAAPSAHPDDEAHAQQEGEEEESSQPRYRRDTANEDPVSIPGINGTVSVQDLEDYFHFIRMHDKENCLAKFICTMANQQPEFGEDATDVFGFFREYEPLPSHTSVWFYKDAATAGNSNGDCAALYDTCRMSVEEMKSVLRQGLKI
ncbi:uncharacterized protein LOC144149189 [Haemaphysalis longicornis]